MDFELDQRLQTDCHLVGELKLSRLLLMDDQQYPWLILVPRKESIVEMYELSRDDQQQLWTEIAEISKIMKKVFSPVKLNIGALGNIVRQLHVHIVARFEKDKAWPGPIWGAHPRVAYKKDERQLIKERIQQELKETDLLA